MSVLLSLTQAEIDDLYFFARTLFSEKKYSSAANIFYILTWLEHNNYDYTLSLGLSYLNDKKYSDALLCFRRCATLNINKPQSSYYAGVCYSKLNLKSKAIKALKTSVSLATRKEYSEYKVASLKLLKIIKP
ncbi:CesD/SycD/LcrH family type III secretion system chaperone [Salmonella enterica subsp. enterica serovar Give]|nr:CesD/SycD/LcrH family type III secretion system chaperone [Salmonella enterica subsp. enterica serovar Give]